jgi:hypothetical protein
VSARRLSIAAIAALAIALGVPVAGAAAEPTGTVTAEYSGTEDSTYLYDPNDPSVDQGVTHLTWDEKITVRPTQSGGQVVGTPKLEIKGKVTESFAPPNQGLSCVGRLSKRPGLSPEDHTFPLNVIVQHASAESVADVFATLPRTGNYVRSSAPDSTGCGVPVNGSVNFAYYPNDPNGPLTPFKAIKLGDLPWSHTWRRHYKDPFSSRETDVHSTLKISGSGRHEPPPRPDTPGRFRAKANAVKGFEQTWQRALYPCAGAYAAVPLSAFGPPGLASQAALLSVLGRICADYATTIAFEIETFKDPPIASFGRLARVTVLKAHGPHLPSCARWNGAARDLCKSLEARLRKLLNKIGRTKAVAKAMKTTIGRETAALHRHRNHAARRQDKHLMKLVRKLKSAERAETDVGAGIAKLMRRAGIPLELKAVGSAKGAKKLSKLLKRHGISGRKQRSALGSLLHPVAIDWLHELETPPGQ